MTGPEGSSHRWGREPNGETIRLLDKAWGLLSSAQASMAETDITFRDHLERWRVDYIAERERLTKQQDDRFDHPGGTT